MIDEIHKIVKDRQKAKIKDDRNRIKSLNVAFQQHTQRDKENYYNKCKEIKGQKKERTRNLFHKIQTRGNLNHS